jgi:hypothetical protein
MTWEFLVLFSCDMPPTSKTRAQMSEYRAKSASACRTCRRYKHPNDQPVKHQPPLKLYDEVVISHGSLEFQAAYRSQFGTNDPCIATNFFEVPSSRFDYSLCWVRAGGTLGMWVLLVLVPIKYLIQSFNNGPIRKQQLRISYRSNGNRYQSGSRTCTCSSVQGAGTYKCQIGSNP